MKSRENKWHRIELVVIDHKRDIADMNDIGCVKDYCYLEEWYYLDIEQVLHNISWIELWFDKLTDDHYRLNVEFLVEEYWPTYRIYYLCLIDLHRVR